MNGQPLTRPVVEQRPGIAENVYVRLCAVVALGIITVVGFHDSVATMVGIWWQDGFGHGFLIPAIALFLLWHRRWRISSQPMAPSWLGVCLLVSIVLLWMLARVTLIQTVEHLAVIAAYHALVIATMGWLAYRQASFPLAFLFLAVPMGITTIPWLMQLTATLTLAGLQTLGIPVYRDGMTFVLPGCTFEIVEACGGFRYLFSGSALAIVMAYLEFRSWSRRVLFFCFAFCCFILLNTVRAVSVMAIVSGSNQQYLADGHDGFGWLLFAALVLLLRMVANRFADNPMSLRGA
jgi:exosortase A